jgi:hypothetical protein
MVMETLGNILLVAMALPCVALISGLAIWFWKEEVLR